LNTIRSAGKIFITLVPEKSNSFPGIQARKEISSVIPGRKQISPVPPARKVNNLCGLQKKNAAPVVRDGI
jgi:hypothetical protein